MRILKSFLTSTVLAASLTQLAFAKDTRPQDTRLSIDQIHSDLKIAKEAYERIHPGYTRYTSQAKLDMAWDSLLDSAKLSDGLSLGEFYISLQDVLADIRCDHTKAELPSIIAKDRNVTPVYLPVIWEAIQGRVLITNPGATDLSRGDEIISIDGRPIGDMMDEVRHLIPVDGQTDQVRDSQMAASLDFMGGAFDHFGALLWDVSPTASLQVKTSRGETKAIELKRILHQDWKTLLKDGKASTDFPDSVTFNRISDNAAYLRIDSFVNYRNPVKPDDIYDPIFNTLKAEGRDRLILDLRDNGGGSTDAKIRLFAHLIDKKERLVKDVQIKTLDHSGIDQYISTWEKRLVNPNRLGFTKNENGSYSLRKMFADETKMTKPDAAAFTGKLIVLTSRSNGSASAALLAKLQDMGRATLIGEETGGSAEGTTAGVLFYVKLPESKIRVRVPVLRDFNAIESFTAGKGVTPDIIAPQTVESFRLGQDPAYEVAMELIMSE